MNEENVRYSDEIWEIFERLCTCLERSYYLSVNDMIKWCWIIERWVRGVVLGARLVRGFNVTVNDWIDGVVEIFWLRLITS